MSGPAKAFSEGDEGLDVTPRADGRKKYVHAVGRRWGVRLSKAHGR
jgi:hypothetical protein